MEGYLGDLGEQIVANGTAVFLDTSIQIARFVHSPEIKDRIAVRTAKYDLVITSEVVKQEFKRRLLKEAQYLLNKLNQLGTFEQVRRHVIDYLPPQQNRKRNICLDTLQTISEKSNNADLTERAKSYLSMLLRFGLDDFEDGVHHVERAAGCRCAKSPVVERKPYKDYEFGTDNCSKVPQCGIVGFLEGRTDLIARILDHLRSLEPSQKSDELQRAQRFLESVVGDFASAPQGDPCLKVGDLIIAMESASIPDFYTFNIRESMQFCKILEQNMIVRPKYHGHDDVVYLRVEDWTADLGSSPSQHPGEETT